MSSYLYSVGTLVCIYIILSVTLSLLIGHLGIFSLAHAALFGVGAYTSAVLTVSFGWHFFPAMLAALVFAGIAGAIIAVPALRVAGEYFIVASFALQIVFHGVFANWDEVTGGVRGIPGVLRPSLGPLDFGSDVAFLTLVATVAALVTLASMWVVRSPYGRMLHLIRDDELVASTLGKPVRMTKVLVTVVAGSLAGLAGVFYGQYTMYLSPDSFTIATSISIMTMLILGGMTSVPGSAFGAAVIVLIPQGLQQAAIPSSIAGAVEQIIFGVLLIALMFLRPQGIFGESKRAERAFDGRKKPVVDEEGRVGTNA